LYDVSSSYLEGHCCPLAQFGFNRDGKRGKMQIVYGLLCAADGCPVAIEVFEGSTGDPATLAAQVDKLKRRFDLTHVVLVGDRGMITQTRINEDIKPAGLDWITALRAPQIRVLVDSGVFQLSLFDQRDLASVTADDYPGERLIVCRNPELAVARRRKREDLLTATERNLAEIQNRVRRAGKPLRGIDKIGLKVGAVVGKYKMAKHFTLTITDTDFSFARKQDAIDAEARLDGIYVIRTNLKAPTLDDSATVRAYKSLAQVERAIRSIKTVDLQIRPIFHWAAPRVRAHVLLCMLAYHLEWHLRQRLAPMLYDDADKAAAEALRTSVVAKAQRSPSAVAKQTHGTTPDGLPVHSLQTLLADLATLVRNTVTTALNPAHEFVVHTRPTVLQQKALDLLAVNPTTCTQ
jgi:transposase